MHNRLAGLLLACLAAPLFAADPEPVAPTETVELFDGRSLDGWYTFQKGNGREDPHGVYAVRDGAIRISGEGAGYLATERAYRDYHLSLEYRWGERTNGTGVVRNSGLLLNGVGPDGAASGGVWMTSLEVQLAQGCEGDLILIRGKQADGEPFPAALTSNVRIAADKKTRGDPAGEPTQWTGRQFWWRNHEPFFRERLDTRGKDDLAGPVGEWTRVEALCKGDRVTVKVNGETVNEAYDLRPAAGRILLQNEGSEVWFRKVVLRPIAKE
jgi:hypothetical protein